MHGFHAGRTSPPTRRWHRGGTSLRLKNDLSELLPILKTLDHFYPVREWSDGVDRNSNLVLEDELHRLFNIFQITPSGLDFARVAKDKRRILNSMPLEMVDGALIIDLPKADREKCG